MPRACLPAQLNVGRVGSNDFVINDTEVSSQHARIAWDDTTSAWQLVRPTLRCWAVAPAAVRV